MLLGRDSPGKEKRVEKAREFIEARSPIALLAGMLGILAPIDGIIFFPLSALAVVMGVLGLRDIRRNPGRPGRWLCIIGIVGGTIGLAIAATLHLLPPPDASP